MNETAPQLPIDEVLPEIVDVLRRSRAVVLKAPPGAGKTTGVPPALIEAGFAEQGQIVLVQPRRLAARSAASRLARTLNTRVGETVGYNVRFDRKASSATKLLAMTPGILLRQLQADPLLENVGTVILDEFHERSLELDLALGMVERIRTSLRPELKLIVMSATLDPKPIVQFLQDAEGLTSEGRFYEVDVRYSQSLSRERLEDQILQVLPEALQATSGHLLVFLPGVGEIRRAHSAIERAGLDRDLDLLELYGSLPPEAQDAAVAPSTARKVVLSTNVAETSVTIPGVTGVIDSGLARVMRYDAQVGLPKLQVENISQASADQRAGRAGRTAPGVCWRLWPRAAHRSRPERDAPEIERSDFSSAALTLYSWGEREIADFPWLTPPPLTSVELARTLLVRLQAIDESAVLTARGIQMTRLPVHPRLARLLVAAAESNIIDRCALAAALLTERDPFRSAPTIRRKKGSASKAVGQCDLANQVDAIEQARRDGVPGKAKAAFDHLLRVSRQLAKETRSLNVKTSTEPVVNTESDLAFRRALLAAYPDRVARRREPESDRGLMVGGRGVRLHPETCVREAQLFLCVDVDSGNQAAEAMVHSASAIEVDWLDPQRTRTVEEADFHVTRQSVVMRRRTYYEDLLLEETPIECSPSEATAMLLFEHATQHWDKVFPSERKEISGLIERLQFLNAHAPELELPGDVEGMLDDILRTLCQSRLSFDELRAAPWTDFLRAQLSYEQQQLLEREAPARMQVPSGNTLSIRYEKEKPPVMEVRLQELFGWQETPRVAKRRVPVQLHLLGPNFRPQQITDDLRSFWDTTYHEVRKELRRRYPKHHWPEDPFTAVATKNALKPRKSKR